MYNLIPLLCNLQVLPFKMLIKCLPHKVWMTP